ncbi:pleckstrin homology (PH) domain superfamily protein [Actinidia rufa]|uniref:Pleckstrin homology (PH) domain superfamily protein n=1 Tax=Actinidia rufa TaxID=165716 RepID=A0A7J0ENY4_9ERIC|nr:pleckstrin homology (PH) domain superfamily protein [Actinidia rufa]
MQGEYMKTWHRRWFVLNKQFALKLSTRSETIYVTPTPRRRRKTGFWINSIGRYMVQHSKSFTNNEFVDYDSKQRNMNLN